MRDNVLFALFLYGAGLFLTCTILLVDSEKNVLRYVVYGLAWPVILWRIIYRAVYTYLDTRFWNDLHELIPAIPPDHKAIEPVEKRYEIGQWKESE